MALGGWLEDTWSETRAERSVAEGQRSTAQPGSATTPWNSGCWAVARLTDRFRIARKITETCYRLETRRI